MPLQDDMSSTNHKLHSDAKWGLKHVQEGQNKKKAHRQRVNRKNTTVGTCALYSQMIPLLQCSHLGSTPLT